MKNIFRLIVTCILIFSININETKACHALAVQNYSLNVTASGVEVNASSTSPTCGCGDYWLDVEIRCLGEPFDAAPFDPTQYLSLSNYPYFQSATMLKPNCVVQAYPTVTIPYANLCPGVDYQVRVRENNNGTGGPWSNALTFTAPGTIDPLVVSATAPTTTLCLGDCVNLDANVIGGCDLAVNYSWSNGANSASTTVCPPGIGSYTYTVDVTEDCSNLSASASITIDVLPPPVSGTASASITTICEGQTTNLTLTGSDGNIQWQSAPNSGGPWSNIGGQTNANWTSPPLFNDICYRAVVSGCGPDEISNFVCIDVLPPGITALNCPGNLTAVCDISEQPAYPDFNAFLAAGGTVTGDLTRVDYTSFTLVSEVSDGLTCPETVTRTYQVTDDCNNTESCTQNIIINDLINPTGTPPPALSVQCIGDVPAANIADVTGVSDNCTINPTVTHVGDASDGNTCPETITRTYRIEDDCGNFIEIDQVITVDDDTNPTGAAPVDVAVQCIGDVPAVNIADVTGVSDNCTVNPTVTHVGDASDGNTCPEVITRTYRIEDDCGNFIEVDQVITVDDDTNPTGTAPADVAVQCIGDVPAANIADVTGVSDNCTVNPTVTHLGDASDGNTCPEVITRTYRIEDDCGNFIEVDQVITVDDDTNPTGTAPVDVAVQCIGDVPAANIADVTGVSDNCTVNPTVTHVGDASDGNTCPEIITRTYRIEDDCGNFIEVDQVITVDDDTNPTGTAPVDEAVQCIGDVPAANIADVTGVSDNCTVNPTVTHVGDASDGNTCPEVITRTYRIEDYCGNFIEVDQVITVDDDISPTASNPPNITVPGGPAPAPDPTEVTDEADNCTANPTVTFVSDVSDGATCPETITRTYRVEDDCGNFIEVEQLILITDPIDPTASNPAPVNVQCIGDVPAPDPTVVIDEADNNGAPTVVWEDDTSNGNTCPEVITRRYRVTDPCGNFIFVEQIITVNDDTNPTGTAPVDVAVQCIGDVPAANIADVTGVSDNCTVNPTVTHVGDASDGNTCPETITRTYRIEDDCGNFIEIDQVITVDDDTNPTGTAPVDVAVQCIGDVPAANIADVTGVSDNCTVNPTVTHVGDASNGNTCPEVITRTYRIEDDCGNFIEVDQVITVDDDINPTASNPPNITVPGGPAPAPDPTEVTDEADNCTANPTVTFVSDVSDGATCPETITRTYRVEDDCGNFIEVEQLILITDPIDPTASNPAPVNVQCIGDVPAPDPSIVNDEADNNGAPTVVWEDDTSNGNTCPEVITRRYRVTDPCGNFIFVEQIITVNDDTNPTGTAPLDVAVQCIGDVPAANIADVTGVSDNCTVNPTVTHVGDASDGNTCPEVITRTYRIEDDCGNFIEIDQVITVDDDINPTGTAPVDVAVQCIGDVPAANIADVTGVSDNCTVNPTVTHVGDASDGNTCPEVITRTYRVEDDCGNFIEVDQVITVDDDIDPTGTAPGIVTVQCIGDVPAANVADVTGVSDNCTANPTVTHVGDVSDGMTCPEKITRTYRIEDDCGNFIEVDQEIIINDNIDPMGTAPADIAVQCISDVPAANIADLTGVSDNCTVNPTVTHVGDASDGNTCPEVITRTYRIEDDCGNFIDVEQIITIDDDINPNGTAPADITVQCIGDVPAADITSLTGVSDNCTATPTVVHESDISDGNSCPEMITRTYSITDDCGNSIEVQQIITVNDDTNPTASNPATTTVACASDVPAVDVNVVIDESDNCTVNPLVEFVSEVTDNNVCNGEQLIRTYSVTDDCGNSINVLHTIIIDSYTPTFTLSSSNPTLCGAADGFITISGLNTNESYDISYNGNAAQTIVTDANGDYVISNLSAGSYTDFSVNPSSCPLCVLVDNTNINLVDPNAPPVNAGVDQTVCEGEQVTLTADNPNGANISWNNGVTDGVSFTPTVGTNNFTVTAEIAGCVSTDLVVVTVNPLPNVDAGNDVYICAGDIVTLSATGADSYSWDNSVVNGVPFTPTETLTYTVEGTTLGCVNTDQVEVVVYDNPVVQFEADNLVGCVPLEVNFTNTTSGSIQDCEWIIGGSVYNNCDVTHVFNQPGCYDVQLTVTSTDGCTSDDLIQDYVCVDGYPNASFSANPSDLTSVFDQAQFTNSSNGATTYEWNFGDGYGSSEVNPSHTFPSDEEGEFEVQLIAYSQYGCADTAYQIISVLEELLFYVPNTFTPDDDKYNPTFKPIFTSGFDPQDYTLLIFDRWGEVIFESNNSSIGWDGTYGVDSDEVVKDGTYVWKIEFKTKYNDERKVEVGHVNLIR